MSDYSDFKKSRTSIYNLLPERFKTEFNRSFFEQTINKLLTKTELTHVVGSIGVPSATRIPEETIHRQTFQLQPLAHATVATVDYTLSFKDFLKELETLGVDISTFDKWGKTETFNFAPPIDFDKLINYVDYVWYDPENPRSTPQYITIRNLCNVVKARLIQKRKELEQVPNQPIVDINYTQNAFVIDGDYTFAFIANAPFSVTGSDSNDNNWIVEESVFTNGKTYVKPTATISYSTSFGSISLVNQLTLLQNLISIYCNDSIGWDTTLWDDNNYGSPMEDVMDAFEARMNPDNSPSLPEYVGIQDPYLFSLLVTTNLLSIEQKTLWDKYSDTITRNPWTEDNKWVHKLDLPADATGIAKPATMPIIEYSHTIALNSWTKNVYQWKYRSDITQPWQVSSQGPSISDIFIDVDVDLTVRSDFTDKWLFVGLVDQFPTAEPQDTIEPISLTTTSNEGDLLLTRLPDNRSFVFPMLPTGNSLEPARNRTVLSGQQDICVYIDGARQYGNYEELTETVGNVTFVIGVIFDDELPIEAFVQINIGHHTSQDQYKEIVNVRVHESDQDFTTFGTQAVSLIEYRKTEQTKVRGEVKYPLFDMFNVDGTPANKVSSIFSFKESNEYPVKTEIGRRIVSSGKSFTFEQHLVEADNSEIYLYSDLFSVTALDPRGLHSIWRTSPQPTIYTPALVDVNRRKNGETYFDEQGFQQTAVVNDQNGDWEIPVQWFNNPSHENRKELTYTELVAHFLSMAKEQAIPETFFTNQEKATRLSFNLDYGKGGTIKEHNNSFDLTVSAVLSTTNTPISVIEFANDQQDSALNFIKTNLLNNALTYLLNTSQPFMYDLEQNVANAVITLFEQNDFLKQVFGDSTAFDETTQTGIRNWIVTLPMIGAVNPSRPVILRDDKLGIFVVRHHDGHFTNVHIDKTTITDIQESLIEYPLSPSRLRGWRPGIPADGNNAVTINTYTDIPYARLLINDYFLTNNEELYRFEVTAIQATSPSVTLPEGSYWLRNTDGQLFIRDNSITGWSPVGAAGDTSAAWRLIEIPAVYAEVLLEVENRLYERSINAVKKWDRSNYVLDNDDESREQTLLEQQFLNYVKENEITTPYLSDYNPSDPFTWNYSTVNVASPSVIFPYTKDISKWGSRAHTIYENIFGTPFPHLEPWKLQGYKSKPTWWDDEYAGTTRKWSTSMWTNIKTGVIPPGRSSPEDVVQIPQYSFVCVNVTNTATSDGYGPDDLLPPYWVPPTNGANDLALQNEVFIRNQSLILAADISAGYDFGDEGPYEWMWRNSSSYLFDTLKVSFLMQPIKMMHTLWGLDYVTCGHLNVDALSKRVASHSRAYFHGDIIDNQVRSVNGINQWYVNVNRFQTVDNKVSDFRELWTLWEPKYAYQIDSFVDPKSLFVRTNNFVIDQHDYRTIVKRTPTGTAGWAEALLITIAEYGKFKPRNNIKTPRGDASDWVFTINNPASVSRTVSYYAAKDYDFELTDINTGTFTTTEPVSFNTGDIVTLYTTDLLPAPLVPNQQYFFIKVTNNSFRLAETLLEATTGTSIVIEQPGQGSHRVHSYISDFFAFGGETTAITWYHNELNKQLVKQAFFPFQITGLQNVIDFIDGYVEYLKDQGFVFNHSDATDLDPATGLPTSWQFEQERLIEAVYTGLGLNNSPKTFESSVFKFEVDLLTNHIVVTDPNVVFEDGDEVFIHVNGTPPTGLILNRPYYIIQVEPSLGRYKLASTLSNALSNIPIVLTSTGTGSLFLAVYEQVKFDIEEYVEVNPFRNNIWFITPRGVVADVIRGPYEEIILPQTLYDQYGRLIDPNYVMVYREDLLTRVQMSSNVVNDLLPTYKQTPYNRIHISGWKVYVDEMEHVVLFNNYITDGALVYDPFLGLGIGKMFVEYDRQTEKTKRPTVGGFFFKDGNLIRNIEGTTEDMQTFYSVYDARESEETTIRARQLFGYKEPQYLTSLGVNDKSKYVFWRGAIQQKGSINAINAFINSKQFVDARVDEFWAFKNASFGNKLPFVYPKVKLEVEDLVQQDIRLLMDSASVEPDNRFVPINFQDSTRWYNLPEVRRILPAGYATLPFSTTVHSVQTVQTTSNSYHVLNQYCDDVIIVDNVTGQQLTEGVDYKRLTNRLIKFLGSFDAKVYNLIPNKFSHSPMAIIDERSQVTIEQPFLWDPAREFDYHVPATYIDVKGSVNPVRSRTERKILAGREMLFDYETHLVSEIDINGVLSINMPYNANTNELFVFIQGIQLVKDVDYTEQNGSITFLNVPSIGTDEIELLRIDGGETMIEKQSGANITISQQTEWQNLEYVPGSGNLLVLINGRIGQLNVDYTEFNPSAIAWVNVPQSTDEITGIVVDTVLEKHLVYGAEVSNGILTTPFKYVPNSNQLILIRNGHLQVPGIHFNEVDKDQIQILIPTSSTDEFLILANKVTTVIDERVQEWGDEKVGTVWWNTTKLGYQLYHDTTFFGGTDEQLGAWGSLAEWADINLLEWTKSSVPPSEYDNLAKSQEGNYTISADDRAAGIAHKFITYAGEFIDETKLHLEFYAATIDDFEEDVVDKFTELQVQFFVPDADVKVYRNQREGTWMKFKHFNIDDYTEYDLVHIERFIKKVKYPRIVIDVGGGKQLTDLTGLSCTPVPVYSVQINFNGRLLYVPIVQPCTYEDLTTKMNASLPSELRLVLNDEGNLQLEAVKSTPDTVIELISDDLFKHITGFKKVGNFEEFEMTDEYDGEFGEDYDFVQVTRSSPQGDYFDYYFWVKNKSISQHGRKLSLNDMKRLIMLPDSPYFLLKKYGNSNEGKRYHHVILRNVRDVVSSNDRYSLVLSIDNSLRDFSSYRSDSSRKNLHEEWTLFRKDSVNKVPRVLWNKLTEAVMGCKIEAFLNSEIVPVPAFDRVLFDELNNTKTRFGLRDGQAFGDKMQLIETIEAVILDPKTDTTPVDRYSFLNVNSFDSQNAAYSTMNYIYDTFPTSTVNAIFFECLADALTTQPIMPDIMKTSYVSLHGIKVLDQGE